MANKSAAKKKSTVRKKAASKKTLPIGIYKENNPDCHVATGKYKFFFVLFGVVMVLFAGISVWLFIFSSEIYNKYQSIEACARNHTTCEVRYIEEDAEEE
ncbi:hypothetical protein IKQ74_03595 [Candidatus Saccharibacteria bacterium]|nr:hypothetical protein [Candidatus Saccharibacteria bacterium]